MYIFDHTVPRDLYMWVHWLSGDIIDQSQLVSGRFMTFQNAVQLQVDFVHFPGGAEQSKHKK